MKVRELIKDAPGPNDLFERCCDDQYSIDVYDLFYIQALSDVHLAKVEAQGKKAPEPRHWRSPGITVAGIYCLKKLIDARYSQGIIERYCQLIDYLIEDESMAFDGKDFKTFDGNPVNSGIAGLIAGSLEGSVTEISGPIQKQWVGLVQDFGDICNNYQIDEEKRRYNLLGNSEGAEKLIAEIENVHDNVDFSSKVFNKTKHFLPFKKRRKYSRNEFSELQRAYMHDLGAFGARLV